MQNQFTVKQSTLKALVLLAAKKDIRYYLCGVNVEFSPSITRVVATDGHKLGLYQTGAQNAGHGALIIPADVINALPKTGSYDPELTFIKCDGNATGWTITGLPNGGQTVFQEIEGNFPDYKRVCSFKTDGLPGNYNPEYLMQFLKVQHLLGGSKKCTINLYQSGKSSALVTLAGVPEFYGVIMPMRTDAEGVTGAAVDAAFLTDLKAPAPALQAVA
jgi:DNA polymerase III subunit beta